MQLLRITIAALMVLIAACPASAQPAKTESVIVRSVIDGDTVTIGDGRSVRLLGIQAPKLSLGRASVADWPLAQESKNWLEKLALNQPVELRYGTTPIDRYGRILAHLYDQNGRWINGEMVREGLARAYSFPDNRLLARDLQKLESTARRENKAIWADDFYKIRNPMEIADEKYQGTFQLVEGIVKDAAEVKKTIYLNFGDNWRDDFTATIPIFARKQFTESKIRAKDLSGQRIRVRGWIDSKNGPMIELTHPEQLEIIVDGR